MLKAAPELHAQLQGQKHLGADPMAEYFAKNVGIRAAKGRFVLATNPDAIFSPAMVTFLARRSLRADTFYTTSMRFDVEWPAKPQSPARYLDNLMDRALNDTRLEGTVYIKTKKERPELFEQAVQAFDHICSDEGGDDGQGSLPGYYDFQAGDFVLAARAQIEEVWAYPELRWTFGVDSSLLCKLNGHGLRNVALLPPCLIVHQHHLKEPVHARRGLGIDELCELCKTNPRGTFDKLQRDPEHWGQYNSGDIKMTDLVAVVRPKATAAA